jgi:putative flippase GtrA
MLKIKKILNPENKKLFIKYVLISLIGYSFIFLGLFIFVDILNWNKTISFMIVYAITYVYLYVIQLKYLFKKKHDIYKLIKFYFSIFCFYILANILFNLGLKLNINYLISTTFTIILLMPFRLIVSKLFVFKN